MRQNDAVEDRIKLKSLRVVCGTDGPQTADIVLTIDGEEKSAHTTGDGPVDSAFNAVKALFDHKARLQLYQVHAVTEGTDAQATVSVRLEEDGRIATGQSADTDTVVASTKAYINALNRLIVRRQKPRQITTPRASATRTWGPDPQRRAVILQLPATLRHRLSSVDRTASPAPSALTITPCSSSG